MTTKLDVIAELARHNLANPEIRLDLEVQCPGDGTARYNFTRPDGRIVIRARGAKEAARMLGAFRSGVDECRASQGNPERGQKILDQIMRGELADPHA